MVDTNSESKQPLEYAEGQYEVTIRRLDKMDPVITYKLERVKMIQEVYVKRVTDLSTNEVLRFEKEGLPRFTLLGDIFHSEARSQSDE